MAELGVPINAWQARGVNSVSVKVCTTFRNPLRLSDRFYATSAVRGVSRSQVVLQESVRRQEDDALVAVSGGGGLEQEGREKGRERSRRKKPRKTKKNSPPQLLLFFPLLSPLSNLPLSLFPSKQTSEVTCATVDNNFRPCRIPEQVRPDLERGAAWFAAGSGSGKI